MFMYMTPNSTVLWVRCSTDSQLDSSVKTKRQ